jgi:hypothetical protein
MYTVVLSFNNPENERLAAATAHSVTDLATDPTGMFARKSVADIV